MRVLLVMPGQVSLNAFFGELCLEMERRGISVHCACSESPVWDGARPTPFEPANRPANLHANLHAIPFERGLNPARHLSSSRYLRRLVQSIRPDIVHAHFSAGIFATALARTREWPVTIATFHGVNYLASTGLKRSLLREVESWAAGRMDETWVLNQKDWAELRKVARRTEVRLQPGYGVGCDLTRFNRKNVSPETQEHLRRRLGIHPDQAVFAFIGRFVHFKGFPIAARAFLTLARLNPNTRFLLVGSRDPLHPSGLTREEELALRNCDQVINVGWQAEVEKHLAIARAVVFPSLREGLPVSLMEALAMGIPVIASNHPGCCAVVRDGVDGLIVARPGVDEYVGAMERLISDKVLYNSLARNALSGRDRFSREHYVREQVRTYESLSSARGYQAEPVFSA